MTLQDQTVIERSTPDKPESIDNESKQPNESSVYRIMYVSECTRQTSAGALREIAEHSVLKNVQKGITGILLLIGNVFFQILEGDEADISNLVYVISKDPRHHHVRVLLKEHNVKRAFGKWSMGFINLSEKYDLEHSAYQTLRKHIEKIIQEQTGSEQACASVIKILPRYLERKDKAAV